MLEVEIKASLTGTDRQHLLTALHLQGFTAGEEKEEIDLYFNGNDRDFRKTDEALRLRQETILSLGKTTTLLTYKGKKLDPRSQSRRETEVTVSEFETAKDLLLQLGYKTVLTVEKKRLYYHRGPITACLDTVSGLGSYVELEQLLPSSTQKEAVIDQLLLLLSNLGVRKENLTQESYLELLMASATS